MSQNLTEIGGWYYFLNNEADYLPYTILTIISSILGILGNNYFRTLIQFKSIQFILIKSKETY